MTTDILQLRAGAIPQAPFQSSARISPAQARADALVSSFVDHATDGYSLAAMVGGGLVYRLGRVGTLAIGSRLVGATHASPLHALVRLGSIGIGFTGEVFAFEAGQRALRVGIGGADPNLLNWSGENGLGRGLVGAAITLGPLKGAGVFAQGQNPVIQHLFQDSAMVLAHNVSDRIFTCRGDACVAPTIAEQFVNAEATLWQMNAGMALVHGAFPRLGQMERSLELGIQSSGMAHREVLVHSSWRIPLVGPVLSAEGISSPRLHPLGESDRQSPPIFMVKGTGGENSGLNRRFLLPSLLNRIVRIEDPRGVEEALSLLYIGTIGPFQPKIFQAIVAIKEETATAQTIIGKLLKNPGLGETVFLSPDLRARILDRIEKLQQGELVSAAPESLPRSAQKDISRFPRPVLTPLNINELLLSLNITRLRELSRIVRSGVQGVSRKKVLEESIYLGEFLADKVLKAIKEADRDFLTGLRNKRGLDRITPNLEYRLIASQRYSEDERLPDYVLMIDIDYFKSVNDNYGHPVGDEVLRTVAQILEETVRPRDIKVRFGGEEFFIFLAKVGREGAEKVAEKIRKAIESNPIEIEGVDLPIRITVSVGAAEMRLLPSPQPEEEFTTEGTLQDTIGRADQALYTAKHSGRNRVHLSDE